MAATGLGILFITFYWLVLNTVEPSQIIIARPKVG